MTIQKILERFDNEILYPNGKENGRHNCMSIDDEKKFKQFVKSSHLSLLLSVKEMVDKMVVNTPNEVALLNKELPTTLQTNYYNQAVGYVDAIEDLQSLLDSEINKIKEL